MPISDIAGEVVGGVLRFVGNLILDFVPELVLRTPGYLLCKPFKKDIDPDGTLVVCVSLAFWLVIGIAAWLIYQQLSATLAMDRCLDSGGAFDRQLQQCITR